MWLMKRLVLVLALMLSLTAVSAQNYAVVNSEKIFKSITAYRPYTLYKFILKGKLVAVYNRNNHYFIGFFGNSQI